MNFWVFLSREISRHWRFSLLFITILGIGLAGFLLVETLRTSIAASLNTQSRAMLGADLVVSARRPFQAHELEILQSNSTGRNTTRTVEFFTMLTRGPESRLVLVKAIDTEYPLFGNLKTSPPLLAPLGKQLSASALPELFVSPEILEQLQGRTNEQISLGGTQFKVSGTLTEDPTQSFRAFALGGRVYLHSRFLENTKLLQPGSTATYSYFFLCTDEEDTQKLKKKLEQLLPDPEIRVSSAKDAGESSTQALSYMGDFLGLVSLIAMLLSSLGAAYLYRSYIDRRRHEISIYRALGLPLKFIQLQATAQIILLAVASLVPAAALARALLPALGSAINLWSSTKLDLHLYPEAFLPLLLICSIGAPLLLLPDLLALRKITPLELFRENSAPAPRPWLQYVPVIVFFASLAPFVARSFRNSGIFLGFLAVLLLALFAVFRLFTRALKLPTKAWTTRHAFLFLSRKQRSATTVFLTLALGSLLLQILPQLEASLRAELEQPKSLPALFLFDIQEEQKSQLEAELAALGHRLNAISPLVRARIIDINGKPFERASANSSSFQTREEEQNTRFRNRGVNLSFRNELQSSESLIAGRPFAKAKDLSPNSIPEISIETKFAKRLNMQIGDIIRFDIQGMEITGRIVNERRVRWTSFQPNFFLVFQEGVLEGAPKTYLANLSAVPREERARIQALLAKTFPNVSVIDVASAIGKILDLLSRMRLALLLIAALALSAGFSVLASVLSLEARERGKSLVIYRALGASERDLRLILITESLLLSSLAIGCGAFGSILFTYGLSRFIFDGAFAFSPIPLFAFSGLLLCVSSITSWLASRSLVKRSPLELLRDLSN